MSQMNGKSAVLVIPTYNEEGNIGILLDRLYGEIFPSINDWKIGVVVVDGNSTDDTAKVVAERRLKWQDIVLIKEGSKRGLGSAYMTGFAHVLNSTQADVVIEFDADLQHPPETVKDLLLKVDEGYDYVLGSRNISGGKESSRRNFFRSFLTSFGGFLARFILFFPGRDFWRVTDPTTGLKATRIKGVIDDMDFENKKLYSRRFGYKVQLLKEILSKDARYAEIPLRFDDRRYGMSKFELNTIFEILHSCLRTRLADPTTLMFTRFAAVGFSGYLVNAIFIAVLPKIIAIEPLIWAFATEMAIVNNFILNNVWTFGGSGDSWLRKFIKFNTTSFGAIIIQAIFGTLLVSVFGEEYRQIILPIIIVAIVMPYNWYMYRKVVWGK